MSILKVARLGHPALRAPARPISVSEIGSPVVQQLIDDMLETMQEYSGIGLAAPQVHVPARVFVAGVRAGELEADMDDRWDMPVIAIINPELTPVGGVVEEGWEGCLSIPDIRGLVPRATEIRVQGYDRTGRRVAFSAKGLPARVIQHETDHLDGVLFLDRMRSLDTLTFFDEYQRHWSRPDDDKDEEE
jgi:peptide deformylase